MKPLFALALLLAACVVAQPTEAPQATYTPAPTYTALPTLTPYPTYTPRATSPALPTPTPHPLNDRWQRPHPIPTARADGMAEASYIEYQCYEQYFYGIADGQTLYLHLNSEGYAACIQNNGVK